MSTLSELINKFQDNLCTVASEVVGISTFPLDVVASDVAAVAS